MTEDEVLVFQEWREKERSNLAGVPKQWGKCQLATRECLRSVFREKGGDGLEEDPSDPHDDSQKANHSSRFAKVCSSVA